MNQVKSYSLATATKFSCLIILMCGTTQNSFGSTSLTFASADSLLWKYPILLFLGAFVILIAAIFAFKKQATYNSEIVEQSSAINLTLKSARIIVFFGSIIIPLGGFVYYLVYNKNGTLLAYHFALGLFLWALASLSYIVDKIKNNVHSYILSNFFIVLAVYQIIIYQSNLEPYFVISTILVITTGSAIINTMKMYVSVSLLILVSSGLICFYLSNPVYDKALYLFGVLASCSVGVLILLVKLNLSEKLIFSDTIVNKGNSLVIAANKQGEIIYVSDNIESILGYTPAEVMGNKWWELTTKDVGNEVKSSMFDNEQQKQTYTRLIKHKDGSTRWIQWTDKHFSNDLVFGIGTDITLQKEYQERFEYIVQNANDLIYTTDPSGNFTFANEMVLKITERSADEFVGMNFSEIIFPSHKKEVRTFYLHAIKNRITKSYNEFPIITKSGNAVWVGQSVTNKFNRITNQYEGTEVICRDINDRVVIQKQLDDNNKQLELLNKIKEKILYAKSIEEVSTYILDALINSAKVSTFISIHINNDWQEKSHVYSAEKNRENQIEKINTTYEDYQSIQLYFPNIVTDKQLHLSKDDIEMWAPLLFYIEKEYQCALIVPIVFESKTIGFINLFSGVENAYAESDSFLLNDIANSVNAFVTSYKQKQIIEEKNKLIEKNNQRLDVLNKSKQKLLSATTITQVHHELVMVLKTNLQNLDRVSTSQFYFQKNQAQLFYLNTNQNNVVESKMIDLSTFTPLDVLKQNQIYYKPSFDTEILLTPDDQHWYDVGIRSVLYAPVFVNNELHGCISLLSNNPNNFDESHKTLIKEIVESTALIIEQIIFKNIISEKNKDITDNIIYAKRIQDAIMPKETALQTIIPESFLFFSQKDILGGDFYWFDVIDNKTFIVVGDCTGHGVSGSLLSILASDIIKQAVVEMRLSDTGTILEYLNHKILSTLNQSTYNTASENEIVDGLDISFAIINHQHNTLSFSSAMHTAYLVRDKAIIEVKGNRKAIGVASQKGNDFFASHIITIKKDDCLYFLTDGYCDQFHHKTSKKFGKNNLKNTLLEINDTTMAEQGNTIKTLHQNWKGTDEQTDDICILGIKI